jgi:hypothetical protein
VTYKEWPVFEYLNSNYEAILGGLGDEGKVVCMAPQSTFYPFYRKSLIGVWYCEGHFSWSSKESQGQGSVQRKMRVFFLKLESRSFQCFSRQASRDCLDTEAGKLEGAGPI